MTSEGKTENNRGKEWKAARETIEEDMEEWRKFKRRAKITAGKVVV